ncbi:hypothetical protein BDP55DRAFT_625589 [Colletotrichum godetiae]|uniref:Uncharacterized protein n=1 Tax=Colletotrichum godetiae TaxID=1209918 RepID=A0AAJ0EZK0_9PEZI|nr:uncharacterized protein BDP55DRAFT_625589 [Colletotrichum godetiae]KAK1701354.1 hypothetical protein BDP55DRAFT_625589 [Colletotrichum godetiae]
MGNWWLQRGGTPSTPSTIFWDFVKPRIHLSMTLRGTEGTSLALSVLKLGLLARVLPSWWFGGRRASFVSCAKNIKRTKGSMTAPINGWQTGTRPIPMSLGRPFIVLYRRRMRIPENNQDLVYPVQLNQNPNIQSYDWHGKRHISILRFLHNMLVLGVWVTWQVPCCGFAPLIQLIALRAMKVINLSVSEVRLDSEKDLNDEHGKHKVVTIPIEVGLGVVRKRQEEDGRKRQERPTFHLPRPILYHPDVLNPCRQISLAPSTSSHEH